MVRILIGSLVFFMVLQDKPPELMAKLVRGNPVRIELRFHGDLPAGTLVEFRAWQVLQGLKREKKYSLLDGWRVPLFRHIGKYDYSLADNFRFTGSLRITAVVDPALQEFGGNRRFRGPIISKKKEIPVSNLKRLSDYLQSDATFFMTHWTYTQKLIQSVESILEKSKKGIRSLPYALTQQIGSRIRDIRSVDHPDLLYEAQEDLVTLLERIANYSFVPKRGISKKKRTPALEVQPMKDLLDQAGRNAGRLALFRVADSALTLLAREDIATDLASLQEMTLKIPVWLDQPDLLSRVVIQREKKDIQLDKLLDGSLKRDTLMKDLKSFMERLK